MSNRKRISKFDSFRSRRLWLDLSPCPKIVSSSRTKKESIDEEPSLLSSSFSSSRLVLKYSKKVLDFMRWISFASHRIPYFDCSISSLNWLVLVGFSQLFYRVSCPSVDSLWMRVLTAVASCNVFDTGFEGWFAASSSVPQMNILWSWKH